MATNTHEFPVICGSPDRDLSDHRAVGETAMSWPAFVLLIVTAFSQYAV